MEAADAIAYSVGSLSGHLPQNTDVAVVISSSAARMQGVAAANFDNTTLAAAVQLLAPVPGKSGGYGLGTGTAASTSSSAVCSAECTLACSVTPSPSDTWLV